jgi:hypothetical protein
VSWSGAINVGSNFGAVIDADGQSHKNHESAVAAGHYMLPVISSKTMKIIKLSSSYWSTANSSSDIRT